MSIFSVVLSEFCKIMIIFAANYHLGYMKRKIYVASSWRNEYYPKAVRQFHNDIKAMEACDACVLVLPCGRSAHTEAGWFAGRGKKTVVYIPERLEPELMYKLFDGVCCTMEELVETLG